jgi:hypothetical protein
MAANESSVVPIKLDEVKAKKEAILNEYEQMKDVRYLSTSMFFHTTQLFH